MGSGGKYTGDGFDDISQGYKKERVYSLGDAYDRKKKNPSTTSKSIEEEKIVEKPGKNKRLKRSAARREAEERNEKTVSIFSLHAIRNHPAVPDRHAIRGGDGNSPGA